MDTYEEIIRVLKALDKDGGKFEKANSITIFSDGSGYLSESNDDQIIDWSIGELEETLKSIH